MPKKTPPPTAAETAVDHELLARKFQLRKDLFSPLPAKTAKAGARRGRRAASPPMAGWAAAYEEERKYYADFPIGRFEGQPVLKWIEPDHFEHVPQADAPFRFIRAGGEVIEPGRMYTDGGSIPRALWSFEGFSPWHYAPAFLIHDWLFDLHHCGRTDLSFEAVRDIMMEGVRTLMETGRCKKDRLIFDLIYAGIDSFVARRIWANGKCALPKGQ